MSKDAARRESNQLELLRLGSAAAAESLSEVERSNAAEMCGEVEAAMRGKEAAARSTRDAMVRPKP